jgi:NADH-quinone oxidoreductase subunit N
MGEVETALIALSPELFLAALGLTLTLLGALFGQKFSGMAIRIAMLGLLGAAALAVGHLDGGVAFGGLVQSNPFVNFAKVVGFGLAAFALWMAEGYLRRAGTLRYEYALLIVFAAMGMGITVSAADMMTLYLGIETLSLSSYVLAAYHRDNARSSEAGMKYFVLGALSSGLILYGMSLVYGFTGETSFAGIAASERSIGMLFGLVLLLTGLAFKVSAAPLHVWTPDVYEGAPTPVVAFFAAAPKITAVIMFANVLFTAFGPFEADWRPVVAIIAGASMLVGAFGALVQTNIKRLLAYSSIANVGYALVAVAAGPVEGGAALLVFMALYTVSTLGLFAGVLSMRRKGGVVHGIEELGGLARARPWLALCLAVLIFSVAGIPPFGGFWGKVQIIEAGLNAQLMPLVIILIIASVISLGYYLRLVWIMYMKDPEPAFERADAAVSLTVTASMIGAAILGFILIGTLTGLAQSAVGS